MPYKNKEDKKKCYERYMKNNNLTSKERMGEWCRNNPEKRLLRAARTRAKKFNLEFDLTLGDIIIPKYCPYLGVELKPYAAREYGSLDVASLDRKDSSRGYTKDNIEVISWLANMMKNRATIKELQLFSLEVLRRFPLDE